jgi:hypothetical protein
MFVAKEFEKKAKNQSIKIEHEQQNYAGQHKRNLY